MRLVLQTWQQHRDQGWDQLVLPVPPRELFQTPREEVSAIALKAPPPHPHPSAWTT